MKIDVVCPLFNASGIIENLIDSFFAQKNVQIGKVVFPVTESDDVEKTIEVITARGLTYFTIKKQDFSHSLTREKAIMEYCENEVVIMTSQDVIFNDENAFFNLASSIADGVIYAYGRQTAKKKDIEHYVRKSNYPAESAVYSGEDLENKNIKCLFSSDAFSAYDREKFIKLGGYDSRHMMMNEDMYYSKKVLESGFKKAYVAEAVVCHSHKYKLKQLYNRYYETGKWFKEFPEFQNYSVNSSGFALAKKVLKGALKDFNIRVLLVFLPNMLARYLGLKKGKKTNK